MIRSLFFTGADFIGSVECDIDALAGGIERAWTDSQSNRTIGLHELELATTLDEQLEAACTIMKADMLGFRALSDRCRRDRELR